MNIPFDFSSLSPQIKDLAEKVLYQLYPSQQFWEDHPQIESEGTAALAVMSAGDFDALLNLIKESPPAKNPALFSRFLRAKHHSLDGEDKKATRLTILRKKYEETSKKQETRVVVASRVLAVGIPVASVYALSWQNLPALGTSLSYLASAGGAMAAYQGAPKIVSSFFNFEKTYMAPDWSAWVIDPANLTKKQNQSLAKNKRLWTELEARFAALSEPERWLTQHLFDSHKFSYLLASSTNEKRRILEKSIPPLNAEIGFLLSGKAQTLQHNAPALGTLKAVGSLGWRRAHMKARELLGRSVGKASYSELSASDLPILSADHFSPAGIERRLSEFREKIPLPVSQPALGRRAP